MQKIITNEYYKLSLIYLGNGQLHNENLIIDYLKELDNEDIYEIILCIRALGRLKKEQNLELRIVKKTGEFIYINFEKGKLVSYIHYNIIDDEMYNVVYKDNLTSFNFVNNALYSNAFLTEEINKDLDILRRVLKK